jgi:predicted ArsR family transcriptional regulator
VREAALAAPPPPPRRARHELVRELGRVLNNLRQLQAVAEIDGAEAAAARIEVTAKRTEAAIRAAPAPDTTPAAAAHVIVAAGRALNELARRANTDEELPADAELLPALAAVEDSFAWVLR